MEKYKYLNNFANFNEAQTGKVFLKLNVIFGDGSVRGGGSCAAAATAVAVVVVVSSATTTI